MNIKSLMNYNSSADRRSQSPKNNYKKLAYSLIHFEKRGSSLTLTLVFFVILSFLIIPIVNIFSYSSYTTVKTKNSMIAMNLAVQTIEEIKAMKFADVGSMSPNDWKSFDGDWIAEDGDNISYPEYYKMFQKQVLVTKGEELTPKNPNLKKVIVNIKWDELTDERKALSHASIKLVTYISKENQND